MSNEAEQSQEEEKSETKHTTEDDKEDETRIMKCKVLDQTSSAQKVYDEKSGEDILQRDIPNKIIVARGKKISFYYERARRVLRLFDGMIVTGFGSTVCIACSLVEVLKRNQMAVITHIETKLDTPINYVNINENYNNPQQRQYYMNAPPQTAIEFHLKVGKYGKYLSGYHQRKIIELFEKYDLLSGVVSVDDVKSMNLYEIFHSNKDQIDTAEEFINDTLNLNGPNNEFVLPDFIKYCSLIIHPLMKDNVFKKILYQNFKIGNYYNLLNRAISDEDMGIQDQTQRNEKKDDDKDNAPLHKMDKIDEVDEVDNNNENADETNKISN